MPVLRGFPIPLKANLSYCTGGAGGTPKTCPPTLRASTFPRNSSLGEGTCASALMGGLLDLELIYALFLHVDQVIRPLKCPQGSPLPDGILPGKIELQNIVLGPPRFAGCIGDARFARISTVPCATRPLSPSPDYFFPRRKVIWLVGRVKNLPVSGAILF